MPKDRVVIIDNAQECETIHHFLVNLGYSVFTFKNGPHVLEKINKERPSIIFINVDTKNGREFFKSFKAQDKHPLIIIICTHVMIDTIKKEFKGQAYDFLLKTASQLEIQIAMDRAFHLIKIERELATVKKELQKKNDQNTAEKVETERFIAVRQIVEKMSSYMSQVTSDVQGGIKYFNELPYFVSIHSREHKVLAANSTYLKYLGSQINKNSWEMYLGKRGTQKGCPVGQTIATSSVMDTRALVRYKSGARVPVLVHTAPIYNNDGEVELVLEVFAGTKEIERLAKEISTTQQRYQILFDAVPSKIAVLDRRFRITAINRRFKKDFGDRTGEIFYDILRPGSFPAYRDPLTRTVRDGISRKGEMVLTDKNGVQYNMMVWTAPIMTATGKLIQVLAIFTDVTELRKLQDNLSSLGLMISTISHDLKGTLTGLDAGLYLIDKGFYRNQPGRIEEGLDVTKLIVDRMKKLVFDILYTAKEREINFEQVDIIEFAGDLASHMENRIIRADIRFRCNFDTELGMFEIDPGLFRSALINIFENAIEACIQGTSNRDYLIEFNVKKDRDQIVFEIIDNAGGMDSAKTKRIFDKFYSLKGRKGTGLGLYITRKAIQKHGGTIDIKSEINQGTRFVINMPGRTFKFDE